GGAEASLEVGLGEGAPDLGDGGVEVGPGVRGLGGRDEDPTVEVGEQPLGAGLVAVEADDAEVIRADLLDAGVQDAAQLGDGGGRTPPGRVFAGTSRSHGTSLREKGTGFIPFSQLAL